jgi:hypothetical protein
MLLDTMPCIQNYSVLWTLAIVQNSKQIENTTFRKLGLFQSSDEGKETPTLMGPWTGD